MARAVSIQCPNCGAPLDVQRGADRVVCHYCQTSSQVVRGGPAPAAPPTATPRFVAGAPPPPPGAQMTVHVPTSSSVGCIVAIGVGLPVVISAVIGVFAFSEAQSTATREGSGSLFGGTADTPSADENFQFGSKAMLFDVDADGTADAIGHVQSWVDGEKHWLAAFDGKKGKRLWRTDEIDKSTFSEGLAAIAGKHVVTVDGRGAVTAYGLKDGKAAWTASVSERADHLCSGDGFVGVHLKDKSFRAFDAKGKPVASAKPEACGPTATTERDQEATAHMVGWAEFDDVGLPDDTPHFLKGYTAHDALVPYDSKVRFLFASKDPGSGVPFIVAHDDRKMLWAVELPEKTPLSAESFHSPVGGYGEGRLAVVYELKNDEGLRLACLDAKTGARQWDVAVPKHSADVPSGIAISSKSVFFTTWTNLFVFSLKTGKLRFTVGRG